MATSDYDAARHSQRRMMKTTSTVQPVAVKLQLLLLLLLRNLIALAKYRQPIDAVFFRRRRQVETLAAVVQLDLDRVRSRAVEVAAVTFTMIAAQGQQVRRDFVALVAELVQNTGPGR